jgi:hypothetical protein
MGADTLGARHATLIILCGWLGVSVRAPNRGLSRHEIREHRKNQNPKSKIRSPPQGYSQSKNAANLRSVQICTHRAIVSSSWLVFDPATR